MGLGLEVGCGAVDAQASGQARTKFASPCPVIVSSVHHARTLLPLPCTQSVVSVLRNCTENAGHLQAVVATAARTAARAVAPPDPARVQQIVEMGFSQAQAEEALRRVSTAVLLYCC